MSPLGSGRVGPDLSVRLPQKWGLSFFMGPSQILSHPTVLP